MSIQTVPGSEMISTGSSAVKADFSQFSRAFSAASDAGASLSNVAKVVGDYGIQRQEIKNKIQAGKDAGILAEASDAMMKSKHEFEKGLRGDTDSEKWGQKWHENYTKQKNEFLSNERISPNLKKQLSVGFDHWGRAGAIDIDTVANKQEINRASNSIKNAMEEHSKSGTPESMQAIQNLGQLMKDRGLAFPEEADELVKVNVNKADAYAADLHIESNPTGSVRFLSEKDESGAFMNLTRLDPHQRETYIRRARAAEATAHKENQSGLIMSFHNGSPPTEDVLEDLVAQNKITAKGAVELMRMGTTKAKADSKDLLVNLQSRLIGTDFSSMSKDEVEEFKKEIVEDSSTLSASDSNTLMSGIDRRVKSAEKEGASASRIILRDGLKSLRKSYELGEMLPSVPEKEVKPGRFWDSTVLTGGVVPEKAGQSLAEWKVKYGTDKRVVAENEKHYDQSVVMLEQFMKDNPKATSDDVSAYLEKLTEPWVLEKTKKILSGVSRSNLKEATKEEYEKLKPGDKFLWRGKELIKK